MLHKKSRSFCGEPGSIPKSEDLKDHLLKPLVRELQREGLPANGNLCVPMSSGNESEKQEPGSPTTKPGQGKVPALLLDPDAGPKIIITCCEPSPERRSPLPPPADSSPFSSSSSSSSAPQQTKTAAPTKKRQFLFSDFEQRHLERKREIEHRRSVERQLEVNTMDKYPGTSHSDKREYAKSQFFYEQKREGLRSPRRNQGALLLPGALPVPSGEMMLFVPLQMQREDNPKV